MKFTIRVLLILFIFFLQTSCSKKEKITVLKQQDLQSQMIELYYEGYEAFLERDILFAAKKFNEAELIFPQSNWAPISALMTAYIYYSDDYYSDAIYHLERYLKVYPNHKDKDYGHYLLGMCYYENIIDEKRDLGPLLNAKKEFEYLLSICSTDVGLLSISFVDLQTLKYVFPLTETVPTESFSLLCGRYWTMLL